METQSRFNSLIAFARENQALLVVITLVLGAFGYAWLIWPTPYLIIHEKGVVFRVNRFTGVREQSTDNGWMTQRQMDAQRKLKEEEKAAEDQAKSDRILTELRLIKVDDARDDFKKISIYN